MNKLAKLKFTLVLLASISLFSNQLNAKWSAQADVMLTPWGEQITPDNVWQQYPRPQLQRQNWLNLNGLWQYAVVDRKAAEPKDWQGDILVPFAIESPLSGVGKRLEQQALWYQTQFNFNHSTKQAHILHFEAVDYACKVWLNDQYVGAHQGGNLPFKFDVSAAIKNGANKLIVRVIDDTDAADRYQLRGKQTQDNRGIWYTPVSGIWQTVWLESVHPTHIDSLKAVAQANGQLKVGLNLANNKQGISAKLDVLFNNQRIASATSNNAEFNLHLNKVKTWSPDKPNLYDLKIQLFDANHKLIDTVTSYVGFRTVGRQQDANGNWLFTLNGQSIFHWGPLDQGWWPDGLLTPPSEAAVLYEMDYLKQAGFNMIRKHKKVESRRYYYLADKMGFLVWQDQVSGGVDTNGGKQEWPIWHQTSQTYPDRMQGEIEAHWPTWAHQQYMDELTIMLDVLSNHPSIVVWTTFNERWGQHNTLKVGEFVELYDPTRHLNIASGGNFFPIGDIADAHHYPEPKFLLDAKEFTGYIKVVGEFGGHGWPVKNHVWAPDREKMIYGNMPKTLSEYQQRYIRSINNLGELKKRGIAAGVYTQTSDVETEINGLLTYDRKAQKLTAEQLKQIHQSAGLIE
ncbi:glycoside hydrolase family 2 protein [Catenovulum adriaticum]|uniref:Glycosyl hydrolase family 2 n=1 Tax=Catenovulum adriaticum TaxID=2984846 RepID=A0ABY7AR80_9ALTE|nr:sugar-binding domain-containing protein [Catenovulum sp. TS8]WAJ71777.1 hypothetical protein OLW01_15680 [Catenovulum sp. TS8]